jgi:hypothetical protein
MRFEVFRSVSVSSDGLWTSSFVDRYQYFGASCYLHLAGIKVSVHNHAIKYKVSHTSSLYNPVDISLFS